MAGVEPCRHEWHWIEQVVIPKWRENQIAELRRELVRLRVDPEHDKCDIKSEQSISRCLLNGDLIECRVNRTASRRLEPTRLC